MYCGGGKGHLEWAPCSVVSITSHPSCCHLNHIAAGGGKAEEHATAAAETARPLRVDGPYAIERNFHFHTCADHLYCCCSGHAALYLNPQLSAISARPTTCNVSLAGQRLFTHISTQARGARAQSHGNRHRAVLLLECGGPERPQSPPSELPHAALSGSSGTPAG